MENLTLNSPDVHRERESCWPEILKRLPVSKLGICLCVSKKWNSLITSKSFISSQINFLSQTQVQSSNLFLLRVYNMENQLKPPKEFYHICYESSDKKKSPKETLKTLTKKAFLCPFKTTNRLQFRLVGCVNGIIFLSDDIFATNYTLILWNPLLNCFIPLPKPRLNFDAIGVYTNVSGFGYDSLNDDFKVVRIAYTERSDGLDETPPRAELYSVNEGEWRWVSAENVEYCTSDKEWSQCFLKGNIHWVAYERFGKENRWSHKRNVLLLFNVEKEKFMMMKLPLELREISPVLLLITEWHGVLCVNHMISALNTETTTGGLVHYDMWVKKEYNKVSSWCKVASVDLRGDIFDCVYWRKNGELLVASKRTDLMSYDPETSKTVVLAKIYPAHYQACSFVESLALLNKDCKNRRSFVLEEGGSNDDEDLSQEKIEYEKRLRFFASGNQLEKFRRQF